MVNKNVLSCLLKDGKEVNAVMLVGRLFHARVTVTRNDRVTCVRVSNIPGNPGNLLQIFNVSCIFSGSVCKFARLSLILVTILVFQSVSVQNISR